MAATKRRGSISIQYVPLKVNDKHNMNKLVRDLPTPIVHFKGFGKGINFKNAATKSMQQRCVATLHSMLSNGGTLVWDGDSYKYGSFTYLIPLLFDELFNKSNKNTNKISKSKFGNPDPKWMFLGFTKQSDVTRFHKSWTNQLQTTNEKCIQLITDNKIRFFLQPLIINLGNFVELGNKALNTTKSKMIVCFGGGLVVKREYETVINPNNPNYPWPNFYVYGVGRYNSSKSINESKEFEMTHLKMLFDFDQNTKKYVAKKTALNIAYFDYKIEKWSKDIVDPITMAKTVGYIAKLEQKTDENANKKSNRFNMKYDSKKGWISCSETGKVRNANVQKNVSKPKTPKTQQMSNPYLDAALIQSLNDFSANKNQQFEKQFNKKEQNTASKSAVTGRGNTRTKTSKKKGNYSAEW